MEDTFGNSKENVCHD